MKNRYLSAAKVFGAVVLVVIAAFGLDLGSASGQEVKIGLFAPLTGFAAADGMSARVGAELAVREINAAGGINGRPIRLIVYDDAVKPPEAVAIANKLIELDKVVAVVSGSYSGATRAAAPIYQKAGIPMIAAYAIHPDITKAGDFIFRNSLLGPIQGKVGAHVAVKNLKGKRLSVLTIDNDFGRTLTASFVEEAKKLGAEIVSQDVYPLGEKEFTPIITRLKGLNPDVVYATAYYSEAAQIARQAKGLGLTAKILGQEGYDSPKFLEIAGPAAEGVIFTSTLNRDDPRKIVRDFLVNYEKEAKVAADMVGASAYDAVRVLATAIGKAGTDPKAIRDTIRGLKNYEGVTGVIRGWNALGEIIKPVQVQIVKGGRFASFAEISDLSLITPPAE